MKKSAGAALFFTITFHNLFNTQIKSQLSSDVDVVFNSDCPTWRGETAPIEVRPCSCTSAFYNLFHLNMNVFQICTAREPMSMCVQTTRIRGKSFGPNFPNCCKRGCKSNNSVLGILATHWDFPLVIFPFTCMRHVPI